MPITAAEQYLIELINRARLDPLAEANRYDLDLNDNLAAGTIGTVSLQVLAPDTELAAAADNHSTWMLDENTFSHTGVEGSSPGTRMVDAGYAFEGSWLWSENLAWAGTTGTIDAAEAIEAHHEGLYRSSGHRVNTFGEGVREVGVAQVTGVYDLNGTAYNSSMLTEQFALSGNSVFVTGVAYTDTDRDAFYSIGEGQADVWFRAATAQTETADAGGYALAIDNATSATIDIGQGADMLGQVTVDLSAGNVKVDLVTNTNGVHTLALSGDAILNEGIDNAYLLGAGHLDLTGNDAANTLIGNRGSNVLSGGDGSDRLLGGNGNDRLEGGAIGDRLYGGNGRDLMLGGTGYDRLYGGNANDRLEGGQGNDRLYGQNGHDRMYGDNGNDIMVGGAGNDVMLGGNGRDIMAGSNGHDRMSGGNSHDRLSGGNGDDRIAGNNGHDRLYGGNGDDVLNGGNGNDRMAGGDGADTFVFTNGTDTILDYTAGIDSLLIAERLLGEGDITDYAEVTDGALVITFSPTQVLTLENITDMTMLDSDVSFI